MDEAKTVESKAANETASLKKFRIFKSEMSYLALIKACYLLLNEAFLTIYRCRFARRLLRI